MLELFQVEELEKRYEMGRWSVGGSVSGGGSSGGNYNVQVEVNATYHM